MKKACLFNLIIKSREIEKFKNKINKVRVNIFLLLFCLIKSFLFSERKLGNVKLKIKIGCTQWIIVTYYTQEFQPSRHN
jgi:hypothetical protein